MTSDQDLEDQADPAFEQFFLVNPVKIDLLIAAAGIRSTDDVVELGAGAGTVAQRMPTCASLTLVEMDDRLSALLAENAPSARVVHGDALEMIEHFPCDILIGNLPTRITEQLFAVLPRLSFRTAVLAVDENSDLSGLEPRFETTEVTRITGADFRPPQEGVSRIIRVSHRE